MEYSIFTYYPLYLYEKGFYSSIDEALTATRKLGITSAEILPFELIKYPFADYTEHLKRNDIQLNTLITKSFFALMQSETEYRKEIDIVKQAIDDACKANAKFVMVVPAAESPDFIKGKLEVRDTIIKGMTEIVEYAKNTDITVTMENFSLNSYPYSTIEEMKYILENVPDLKFTIDSGNFYCVKNDILRAYEELKHYVVNVHLKDWCADTEGTVIRPGLPVLEGCTLGTGFVPIKELLLKLKADNYNGSVVMELNTVKITPENIGLSVDFINRTVHGC